MNGYTYTLSDGNELWSRDPMTADELAEHEAWMNGMAEEWERLEFERYYEEQDSDGYGWERRALARIG